MRTSAPACTPSATSSPRRNSRTSRSPEAIVAIKTMLGEHPTPLDYDKVPWGIYCHPEVAFCGLTEAQAKEPATKWRLRCTGGAATAAR